MNPTSPPSLPGPPLDVVIAARLDALGLDADRLSALARLSRPLASTPAHSLSSSELQEISRFLGVDLASYDPDEDLSPAPLPEIVTLLKAHDQHLPIDQWRCVVEAAEIARDVTALEALLGLPSRYLALSSRYAPDARFDPPIWSQGQRLAMRLRTDLGLNDAPIPSMRQLCERLGVYVLDVSLPTGVLGLCLADPDHGPTILLNVQGPNESALTRRFSLAHELCHILFDRYAQQPLSQFDIYDWPTPDKPDIEVRADAFAIHLLAPQAEVQTLWSSDDTPHMGAKLQRLCERFGISYSSALNFACGLQLISNEHKSLRIPGVDARARASFERAEAAPTAPSPSLDLLRSGLISTRTLQALNQDLITHSRALELLNLNGDQAFDLFPRWHHPLGS